MIVCIVVDCVAIQLAGHVVVCTDDSALPILLLRTSRHISLCSCQHHTHDSTTANTRYTDCNTDDHIQCVLCVKLWHVCVYVGVASQQPYLLTYVKLFIFCIVLTILDNSEVSYYLTYKCVDNRCRMIVHIVCCYVYPMIVHIVCCYVYPMIVYIVCCYVYPIHCVYLLYVQSLFEAIFGNIVLRPLFVTADNSLHEWHFRWRLDRYVSSRRQVTLLTTAL